MGIAKSLLLGLVYGSLWLAAIWLLNWLRFLTGFSRGWLVVPFLIAMFMAGNRIGKWFWGAGWAVFLRQVFMVVAILIGVVGTVSDMTPVMNVLGPTLLVGIAWGYFGKLDEDY